MFLTPTATETAVTNHHYMVNHRKTHYTWADRDEWAGFIQAVNNFSKSAHTGYEPGSFALLLETLHPIWVTKINHNLVHDFSVWLPHDYLRSTHTPNELYTTINNFFTHIYGKDEATVNKWVERIEEGLKITSGWFTVIITPSFYETDFPVNWLTPFVNNNRYYLPYVIRAFNKGYTPTLVKQTNSIILSNFTVAETEAFLEQYGSKLMKQLSGLQKTGTEKLTYEVLKNLADAGYTTLAEVKTYARVFGINIREAEYYNRLVRAKTLYPVLADYTPVV